MKATGFYGLMMTVFFCIGVHAQQPAESASQDETGSVTWLGGIGSLEDEHLSWHVATLRVPKDESDISGKLRTDNGRRYSITVAPNGDNVNVTVRRRRKDRMFSGRLKNGVLFVTSDDGEVPNRLILKKIASVAAEHLSELAGMYELSEGHRVSFREQEPGMAMTDHKTGQVRFLYPVGDDRFVAGPAISIPDPVELEFHFQRDEKNVVSQVMIKTEAEQQIAKRRPDLRIEEFVYPSFDGTKIAGSLYRPPGDGPFPAIVCVHGSGMVSRNGVGSWPRYFADLGFAVLAVDKRGIGKSEGNYQMPDGSRDNFSHMRRRSKDVAAAITALSARSDIRSDRIGLSGGSQAGWVIPMTVGQADVAFAIILSGGATPLSVEGKYSGMASENSSGSQLPGVDELIEELRAWKPHDPGIEKELTEIRYPCLWLYGYKDRSNPSQICEDLIRGIGSEYESDFTVKTFPNANHSLLECRFGGSAESRSLQRLVPGMYDTIENWLSEKQLLPNRQ